MADNTTLIEHVRHHIALLEAMAWRTEEQETELAELREQLRRLLEDD